MLDVRMTSVLLELSRHQIPLQISALRKKCTSGVMAAVLQDARRRGWAESFEPDATESLFWQITPLGRAQLCPAIPPVPLDSTAQQR